MSLRRGLFSTLILATSLVAACSTIQPERSIGRELDDANASLSIKSAMLRTEGFALEGVDVEVTEAGVVASFQLEAPVRQTARRLVTIDNPLPSDAPVTFAEGDGWLACHKPPGIAVHDGEVSLLRLLQPLVGDAPLRACHRLDRETSGVILLATSQEAAAGGRRRATNHMFVMRRGAQITPSPRPCAQRPRSPASERSPDLKRY